jgi:hypothetical protein
MNAACVSERKVRQTQEVKKAAPSDEYKAPAENIEISPARGARGGGGMVNQAPEKIFSLTKTKGYCK